MPAAMETSKLSLQRRPNFLHQRGHRLRLDGQHKHLAGRDNLTISEESQAPRLGGERLPRRRERIAGPAAIRTNQACPQPALRQRRRHAPGTQKADLQRRRLCHVAPILRYGKKSSYRKEAVCVNPYWPAIWASSVELVRFGCSSVRSGYSERTDLLPPLWDPRLFFPSFQANRAGVIAFGTAGTGLAKGISAEDIESRRPTSCEVCHE